MRKKPSCKNCGGMHYTYQCWKKKKIVKTKKVVVRRRSSDSSERQRLIKELDRVTSLYVRQKGMDKNGFNYCYTCGGRYHWKSLDCGHYIKRRYLHTRWDLDNVRPQCQNCNRTLGGNYGVYEKKIANELGKDNVLKLWDKAYDTSKISAVELEQRLKVQKLKLAKLTVDFCNA